MLEQDGSIPNESEEQQNEKESVVKIKKEDKCEKTDSSKVNVECPEERMGQDEYSSSENDEEDFIHNVEVEIIEGENFCSRTDKESSTSQMHFLEGGSQQRRKKADPKEWHDSKNRRLRELGLNYVGWSRPSRKNGDKTVAKRGVERKERRIGPPCTSPRCRTSSTMQCNLVSEVARRDIFNSFWHNMTWDQKRTYVVSLVQNGLPKRRRKGVSRRSRTLTYTLREPGGETFRVCKKLFMSTLDLGEWSVLNWVNKASSEICESQTAEVEDAISEGDEWKQ